MCALTDEIPLSLVYGSEATVLPIKNKVFLKEREETFHCILKRINEGILRHSTRKSSLEKMKSLKKRKEMFHSILKRINEGILEHSIRKPSLKKES